MLGLAQIAEYVLSQTQQNTQMQLVDEGTRYRIQFKKPVNLEPIAQLNYTNPFPPVRFTPQLREATEKAIASARLAAQRKMPQPIDHPKKCQACSLIGICLPFEVNSLEVGQFVEVFAQRTLYGLKT